KSKFFFSTEKSSFIKFSHINPTRPDHIVSFELSLLKTDNIHIKQAEINASCKEWSAALLECNEAIQNSRNEDEYLYLHLLRGNVYLQLGKYYSAISDFNVILEKKKNLSKVYFLRGVAYHFAANYQS